MLKKPVYVVMLFQFVQFILTAGITLYTRGYPSLMGTEAALDYVEDAARMWCIVAIPLVMVFGAYAMASQIPRWDEESKRRR